ncbi:MAG: UDPGP type 1 family protein [Planctomycetota bacterium]|nr:MAG: UDPGP type 1 family protein [Planctomycetota bacterium]
MTHPRAQKWLDFFEEYAKNLSQPDQGQFLQQVSSVDWPQVAQLVEANLMGQSSEASALDASLLKPADVVGLPSAESEDESARQAAIEGQSMLRAGAVGVVIVAGGQGSRLGFEGPKGVYPIGAVTGASLFFFHARKVLALSRKYGKPVPLMIMTSPENDAASQLHFQSNDYFGLNPEHVRFFTQGQMPAVDRITGEPLFASSSRLALAPDGHGGCLYALSRAEGSDGLSAIDWAEQFGVRTLFYFQVDNPLVKIADPLFLGLHRQAAAEVSFKVVSKQQPEEKVGVVCQSLDGRKLVIEYSDLPETLARQRATSGALAYRSGSIAVHLFETEFLKRLAVGATRLPFHKAIKKVSHWDPHAGQFHEVQAPNAVKFEAFIFDTLPLAERSLIVETDRLQEFEPLKNATGPDSPSTVRAAMSRIAARLVAESGVEVPLDDQGEPLFAIELDPCFEVDLNQLKTRLGPGLKLTGDLALG